MTKTYPARALLMVAVLVAALMATASPAMADLDAGIGSVKAPISDHDGDADSDGDTAYNEDNDSNDGTANNVEDDGDNAHPSGNDKSVENGGSGTQGKSESNPDDSKGPMRYEGAQGDDKANGPGGTDLADQDGNNGCGNDDDFNDDNNGWCGKPTKPDNTCSEHGHSGWECSERNDEVKGNSDNVKSDKDECPDASDMGKGHGQGNGCGSSETKGSDSNGSVHSDATENADKDDDDASVLGRSDMVCPAGSDNAGDQMADFTECNEDEVAVEDAGQDDSVLGKVLQNAGPLGTAVKKASSALGAVLPFTGNGDVMAFLLIAAALIAGGMFLLLRKKKTA